MLRELAKRRVRDLTIMILVVIVCLFPKSDVYADPNRQPGDPPATVSGSIVGCGGTGGWCGANAYVMIRGNEPLDGYSITAIQGYKNGAGFSCGGSTCDVNLSEGGNTITFWAVSSYGDTSAVGKISVNVDKQPPGISLSYPAPDGLNDWYVNNVSISVSGDDGESGIAKVTVGWSGGPSYSDGITLVTDGIYLINGRAVDRAGNVAGQSVQIKLDTTPPTLTYSYSEPDGENGWYVTPFYIETLATDILSGVNDVQILDSRKKSDVIPSRELILEDGTILKEKESLINSDGYHIITLKSDDLAGNINQDTFVFKYDATKPTADIKFPASMSKIIKVEGTVSDSLSGVDRVFFNRGNGWIFVPVEGGMWSAEIDSLENDISDGYLDIGVKVYDKAGNVFETTQTILVFNHIWPFCTLIAFSIALALISLLDPRPREWRRLSQQIRLIQEEFNTVTMEDVDD